MQVDKLACSVYSLIIKELVWKPSFSKAIVKQGIKSSWSAGVCVAVITLQNRESDVGAQVVIVDDCGHIEVRR